MRHDEITFSELMTIACFAVLSHGRPEFSAHQYFPVSYIESSLELTLILIPTSLLLSLSQVEMSVLFKVMSTWRS